MSPEELDHYSAALDEIWALRQLCADEAAARSADLEYKTYPKSRRKIAEERITRLRGAARGHAEIATAGRPRHVLSWAMKEAGAEDGLTRGMWEKNRGRPA